MTISLITENRGYAIVAMVSGDPEKTVVGHITYQPQKDGEPASTWLADAFGVSKQETFLSIAAAEYWLLAQVIEYAAQTTL